MCGIFALLNNHLDFSRKFIDEQFQKGQSRGPEFSKLTYSMIKLNFGFHRLAINGLNERSNQPIIYKDMALICNGEIYNYRELYAELGTQPTTDSDCEVILHLYEKYDMEHTLQLLDGVFSFVLIDYRFDKTVSKLFVARDPFGVRPLYQLYRKFDEYNEEQTFVFASELKVLTQFQEQLNVNGEDSVIEQFQPGAFSTYELPFRVSPHWKYIETVKYHSMPFSQMVDNNRSENYYSMNTIAKNIQHYFINAVEKRCGTTERPIACLLSGGLDSSLVTALVNEYHTKNGLPKIETYSIGLAGSVDLKYAKIVADYLGTRHTEIIVSEDNFLNAIPEVIYSIESYDTTTVRASIGNWLLGKYIAANSEAKVIFNGDGADELAGGYLYTRFAKTANDFDHECKRLLKDIYKFDVLRSDKCIASHGLEPRTPFLDRGWVQYYLSLPAQIRFHGNKEFGDNKEKYLIRYAFSTPYFKNHCGKELLPDEILWRKKEAFSDGVSKEKRSLYEIIQDRVGEFIEKEIAKSNEENLFTQVLKNIVETGNLSTHSMKVFGNHLPPTTKEQFYYRYLFHSYFPDAENVVPYFWMPKFVEATDASARTLDCYNEHYYDVTEQGLSI